MKTKTIKVNVKSENVLFLLRTILMNFRSSIELAEGSTEIFKEQLDMAKKYKDMFCDIVESLALENYDADTLDFIETFQKFNSLHDTYNVLLNVLLEIERSK